VMRRWRCATRTLSRRGIGHTGETNTSPMSCLYRLRAQRLMASSSSQRLDTSKSGCITSVPVEPKRQRCRHPILNGVSSEPLDQLSSAAGLSRFHLLRTFTNQVGIPPHAYQIRVRIEHARRLLRMGMPSVAAANAVGFADQSHLTRHFKRVLYETPGAYARGRP